MHCFALALALSFIHLHEKGKRFIKCVGGKEILSVLENCF